MARDDSARDARLMQDGIADKKTVVDTGNNKQPQER